MSKKSVMLNFRVTQETADALDLARGSESRSGFLSRELEGLLAGDREPVDVPTYMRESRPAKPVRLDVARRVKTAAEAKAGLMPLDWKAQS